MSEAPPLSTHVKVWPSPPYPNCPRRCARDEIQAYPNSSTLSNWSPMAGTYADADTRADTGVVARYSNDDAPDDFGVADVDEEEDADAWGDASEMDPTDSADAPLALGSEAAPSGFQAQALEQQQIDEALKESRALAEAEYWAGEASRAVWGGSAAVRGEWRLPESANAWVNPHKGLDAAVAAQRQETFVRTVDSHLPRRETDVWCTVDAPFWTAATRWPAFDSTRPGGIGGVFAGHAAVWRLDAAPTLPAAPTADPLMSECVSRGELGAARRECLAAALGAVGPAAREWYTRFEDDFFAWTKQELPFRHVPWPHLLASTTAYLSGWWAFPLDGELVYAQTNSPMRRCLLPPLLELQCLAARGDARLLRGLDFTQEALYQRREERSDVVFVEREAHPRMALRFDRVLESPMQIAVVANHLAFVAEAFALHGPGFSLYGPGFSLTQQDTRSSTPTPEGCGPSDAFAAIAGAAERGHLSMFELLYAAYSRLSPSGAAVAERARTASAFALCAAVHGLAARLPDYLPMELRYLTIGMLFPAAVGSGYSRSYPSLPP